MLDKWLLLDLDQTCIDLNDLIQLSVQKLGELETFFTKSNPSIILQGVSC